MEFSTSDLIVLFFVGLAAGYLAYDLIVECRDRKRESKRFAHLLKNAPGQQSEEVRDARRP